MDATFERMLRRPPQTARAWADHYISNHIACGNHITDAVIQKHAERDGLQGREAERAVEMVREWLNG